MKRSIMNIGNTSFLVIASTLIVLSTIAGIVAITLKKDGDSGTIAISQIVMATTPLMGVLLVLIKQQQNTKKLDMVQGHAETAANATTDTAERVNEVVKAVNGNLEKAIAKVGDEVRMAERDQLVNMSALPANRVELIGLIEEITEKALDKAVDRFAHIVSRQNGN